MLLTGSARGLHHHGQQGKRYPGPGGHGEPAQYQLLPTAQLHRYLMPCCNLSKLRENMRSFHQLAGHADGWYELPPGLRFRVEPDDLGKNL